jgi:hypothetical protein
VSWPRPAGSPWSRSGNSARWPRLCLAVAGVDRAAYRPGGGRTPSGDAERPTPTHCEPCAGSACRQILVPALPPLRPTPAVVRPDLETQRIPTPRLVKQQSRGTPSTSDSRIISLGSAPGRDRPGSCWITFARMTPDEREVSCRKLLGAVKPPGDRGPALRWRGLQQAGEQGLCP